VSADVWEALDTERRAEREKLPRFHNKEKVAVVGWPPSWREKGNCMCLANLLHYIMDIILTCEFLEKP